MRQTAALWIFALFLLSGTEFAHAELTPSGFIFGPLGLNTVPSARMDKPGTIRASLSTLDPYIHASIGAQFTDGVYISLRQSAESSSLREDARTLSPGVDIKMRLRQESGYGPEIALGLQSAIGDRRMAGEYITFSKRYKDLDFTAGIGWGRYGNADHAGNPLKALSGYFGKSRDPRSEKTNSPSNWFSGDSIGLFGGVEYALPVSGLSLKLDYNGDDYAAEKALFDYDAPSPWGVGLSYSPHPWINAGIGAQGTDKIMARLSLQPNFEAWHWRRSGKNDESLAVRQKKLRVAGTEDSNTLYSAFSLSADQSLPYQVGQIARTLHEKADAHYEAFELTPVAGGLRGPSIRMVRKDVENLVDNSGITVEEIWKNTDFAVQRGYKFKNTSGGSLRGITQFDAFYFTLDNQISLGEKETGAVYCTSLLAQGRITPFLSFLTVSGGVRLNLADNLNKLAGLRGFTMAPVRSDSEKFIKTPVTLDHFILSYSRSITPNFHVLLASGYLEEQYAGMGGEMLYRPFSGRFAIGADAWSVTQRHPDTALHLGKTDFTSTTAHVNAWYKIPDENITLSASFGRFLAGDTGGSFGIEKTFENGAELRGFVTLTNQSDKDYAGHDLSAYHGLQFRLPLGNLPYVPSGSNINTEIEPLLRNDGQRVRMPLKLFELTKNFTLDHAADRWSDIKD